MCVTDPGRVVEIADAMALVETDGRRMRASLMLVPDVAVGDWVIVAAGTVLEILEPEAAEEIRGWLAAARQDEAAVRSASSLPDRRQEHLR